MSELTLCNHCSLQIIKRRAKKESKEVTIIKNIEHGGTDVYVHSKSESIDKEKDFAAWFMELSSRCCC